MGNVSQPVCPYCVQWRCRTHGLDYGFCDVDVGCEGPFEPYWANGQVATITQSGPCSDCQTSLNIMYADREAGRPA